ncbi:type I-F CRISPR-associated protein Csy1 [Thioalkalicoccus limnaeus]|uniref:Type I-F CRISPR-associated protein Csy1 n=1 Tax=Thioalkalicoccus limnaeus TaxID=120681 RepID=A0ABV4B9K0_9GAMM
MSTPLTHRQARLRALIQTFLSERLKTKLDKLRDDDPKRALLIAQFESSTWLEEAARRVAQIQAVTHSLKPIHPDAKGTNLYHDPAALPVLEDVGSHVLGSDVAIDVVGNAAVLDVYKLLKLEDAGSTLLELSLAQDADLAVALSDAPDIAQRWMSAFASLVRPRGGLSSHTFAKQLYWPVGDDPHDDATYHLLAPLYPTSLVHRLYQVLQDDRFGEEAKAAREARKGKEWHVRPVREYSNLAVQTLGGSKPQNISQLNSERRGVNYLLASLPPVWQSRPIQPLLGSRSLFERFGWRREVRSLTEQLKRFLESDPQRNLRTRQHRDLLVDTLIEELIQFTAEMRTLEPGWSAEPTCLLSPTERAWLDQDTAQAPSAEVIAAVADAFARWLNNRLRQPLPVGDPEYLYWRKLAGEQLCQYIWETSSDA